MSNYALLLSLGHNSSAIALCDGKVLGGYETERMTQKKSDSTFPYGPINELLERFDLPANTDTYVSHWFVDAELPSVVNKYWDPEFITSTFPNGSIKSLSIDFTHHDAHMWSSIAYVGEVKEGTLLVVADGFGNFGECISFYRYIDGAPKPLKRAHGFDKSLGLLYQYATAYMGMKMHNHEYKILGYEAHISELVSNDEFIEIDNAIQLIYNRYCRPLMMSSFGSIGQMIDYDPLINMTALINTQLRVNDLLDEVVKSCGLTNLSEYDRRVVISYVVQSVTERVIVDLIETFNPTDVICSGGLFYNVKLNYLLNKKYNFEVMPLAGDQGAAIGVYHNLKRDFVWPDHLAWGHREFYTRDFDGIEGIICLKNDDDIYDQVIQTIKDFGFVNIVRGAMEFGPRALCNTTTLALPVMDVVNVINDVNDRTTVMPMAPVVTEEFFNDTFEVYGCKKSYDYMIVATKYKLMDESMHGAAHYYFKQNEYTGRPQIVRDPLIKRIVEHFGGILINTSFNVHGVPIVFDAPQVIHSHKVQSDKGISPIITIVKTED